MTIPLRISKDCIYRYWSIAKCSLHRSRHLLRSEGLGWYHGWDGSGSLANEIFPFCTCFTLKCSDVDFHGWCVWWQCFLISGSGTVEALLGFEYTLFLLKAVQYWEVAQHFATRTSATWWALMPRMLDSQLEQHGKSGVFSWYLIPVNVVNWSWNCWRGWLRQSSKSSHLHGHCWVLAGHRLDELDGLDGLDGLHRVSPRPRRLNPRCPPHCSGSSAQGELEHAEDGDMTTPAVTCSTFCGVYILGWKVWLKERLKDTGSIYACLHSTYIGLAKK